MKSLVQMKLHTETILRSVKDESGLNVEKGLWKASLETAVQLKDGIGRTGQKLQAHVEGKQKKLLKDRKDEAKTALLKSQNEAKQKAKEMSEQIEKDKKKHQSCSRCCQQIGHLLAYET